MTETRTPRATIIKRSASTASRPSTAGELALYNGISDRSRGWKSRTTTQSVQVPVGAGAGVFRWDGASRSHKQWDSLRKDPELWARNGNCHVHLYGRGQSRRGPAFKIPFSMLLEANCQPLITRFLDNNEECQSNGTIFSVGQARDQERVDLFIPAPPGSDKKEAFNYHLVTRNFFAFLFRRSLVGCDLGSALIDLLHRLQEFRDADAENMDDLMSYMDEEGYLECENHPSHALAMLHFAETFQIRDAYINALAHCSGMSEDLDLFLIPEYQLLSSATRKLIRQTRTEMDVRLSQASASLGSFLQDELSEANLGLSAGARAHLERFRTLLHGYFAAKFGYYPPASIDARTTIFAVKVFRAMAHDFNALYGYLVDESFDMSQTGSLKATGGLCALQSVLSFDTQHGFNTKRHPLPLLPAPGPIPETKRAWYSRSIKSNTAVSKNATYVALLNATNHLQADILDNSLVGAYRRFEGDSVISPLKADEQENLSAVDARKVRWILIYAMHQILQHHQPPPEVNHGDTATYHICISTTNLPPWEQETSLAPTVRIETAQALRTPSPQISGYGARPESIIRPPLPASPRIELEPDVDYLALAQRRDSPGREEKRLTVIDMSEDRSGQRIDPPSRPISRGAAIRRSLKQLATKSSEKLEDQYSKRLSFYHEIVVQGYGNGTNAVRHDRPRSQPAANQSPCSSDGGKSSGSRFSDSNSSGVSYAETVASSVYAETISSSVYASPDTPTKPHDDWPSITSTVCSCKRSASMPYSPTRPKPPGFATFGRAPPMPPVPPAMKFERRSMSVRQHMPPPLSIRKFMSANATTNTISQDGSNGGRRRSFSGSSSTSGGSSPTLHMPSPLSPKAWDALKRRMEHRATSKTKPVDYSDCIVTFEDDEAVQTEWEQYNDLGGLTEYISAAPSSSKLVGSGSGIITTSLPWRPRSTPRSTMRW